MVLGRVNEIKKKKSKIESIEEDGIMKDIVKLWNPEVQDLKQVIIDVLLGA